MKKYGLKIYDMMLDVVPADAVFIGRPTPFVNPWSPVKGASLHKTKTAAEAVNKFREYAGHNLGIGIQARYELRGKNLSCNCGEKDCHAAVLMELANEPAPPLNKMLQERPERKKS